MIPFSPVKRFRTSTFLSSCHRRHRRRRFRPWPADAQPAQPPPSPQRAAAPTHANLEYAPAQPPSSNGHKLDLYIPTGKTGPLPTVIWTGGSAWMADNGKNLAGQLAARLNPAGYAVAGVSIRSSSQVQFPGQLHDIKAAIRWLRANAAKYGLDADRIAIVGDSSGGWTSSMAAVTGDVPGARRIGRRDRRRAAACRRPSRSIRRRTS